MPGYIRGTARQRGRDTLSTTSSFSTENVVPQAFNADDQETREDQCIGGAMRAIGESCPLVPDREIDAPASVNGPVMEEVNNGSAARAFRGFNRAEASSTEEPTVFAGWTTDPYAQRRAEDRFITNSIRFQRDGHGSSLVIPRSYVIVFLSLVGFIIGWDYLASRGNYFCIKLEIEGYDLS